MSYRDTYCFLFTPDTGSEAAENARLAQLLRDFAEHVLVNGLKASHFEAESGEVQQLV